MWKQSEETRSHPHPDCSANRSDDELPGRFLLLFRRLSVLQLLLRWAEGTGELHVSLVQGDLLPFKVGLLIKNPPDGDQEEEMLEHPACLDLRSHGSEPDQNNEPGGAFTSKTPRLVV